MKSSSKAPRSRDVSVISSSKTRFYAQLGGADRFELVTFDERWFGECAARHVIGRAPRVEFAGGHRDALREGRTGALFRRTAWSVPSSRATRKTPISSLKFCWEIIAAKVTASGHSLRSALNALKIDRSEIDYVISRSEEAVGDRYNRGGGNLAKAIAEDVGCENASGSDTKAFCAGPMYAMVHGASLIQSGVAKKVAVVAGGSLAKLGMKFESHLKRTCRFSKMCWKLCRDLSACQAETAVHSPRLRRISPRPGGVAPQAMAESLAEKPLAKLGLKLTDIDRYGVELHNPEITVPSGSGDVPRTNYLTLAALAVMRGQIQKSQMEDFVRHRGMLGYAPTQGHIPSAIVYLGHAMESLRAKKFVRRC